MTPQESAKKPLIEKQNIHTCQELILSIQTEILRSQIEKIAQNHYVNSNNLNLLF